MHYAKSYCNIITSPLTWSNDTQSNLDMTHLQLTCWIFFLKVTQKYMKNSDMKQWDWFHHSWQDPRQDRTGPMLDYIFPFDLLKMKSKDTTCTCFKTVSRFHTNDDLAHDSHSQGSRFISLPDSYQHHNLMNTWFNY